MNQKYPDHLLALLQQVAANYQVPPPKPKQRGAQPVFSPLSFLLLAVVGVVTKTFCDSELFRLLASDEVLRAACGFSRTPHRTTISRRLKALPANMTCLLARKETIELLFAARVPSGRHQRLSDERHGEKRGGCFSRSVAGSDLLAAKLSSRQTASGYQRTD